MWCFIIFVLQKSNHEEIICELKSIIQNDRNEFAKLIAETREEINSLKSELKDLKDNRGFYFVNF